MLRQFTAIAAAGLLAGCATGGGSVHEHSIQRGIVPAVDEFGVQAAQQLCNIDSLAEQREEMIEEVRRTTFDSDQVFGPDTTREADTTSTTNTITPQPPYMNPPTQTVELVRTFVTDLDASYRFVTQSCQAYAMCMHQNGFDENDCSNSRAEWSRAQARFEGMSERLSDVRTEIATQCPDCWRPYRGGGRVIHRGRNRHGDYLLRQPAPNHHYGGYGRTHRPHYRGHYKRDCDDGVLGDVFTTGTCNPYREPCRGSHCRY